MAMVIQLLTCGFLLFAISHEAASEEKDCVVYAIKLYDCEGSEAKSTVKATFKDGDNNERAKIADADIDLSTDIGGSTVVEITIEQLKDDKWEEIYTTSDGFCKLQNQVSSKSAKKFREATDPKISDECKVDAGKYSLKNFELNRDDVDFPISEEMKIIATMKLFKDKNDENEFLCLKSELEIVC